MFGGADRATPVVQRLAVRVVMLDPEGRTLLFRGGDPTRPELGTWWFTPGGGVHPGESLVSAARREVLEETGLMLVDPGDVVWVRTVRFKFEGSTYNQVEHYFVVDVEHCEVDTSHWTDLERRSVHEHRWWVRDELRRTEEPVHPEELLGLVTGR